VRGATPPPHLTEKTGKSGQFTRTGLPHPSDQTDEAAYPR